ncbi:MAG TPA: D-alanine--D-alanine ligase [Epulopiscium sp.]|nr:D-alanine--D-alanine ligase [Candidatus Epulonipiscium sp.]
MKRNIVVLFGGQSPEHEVSLKSATTIIQNIDKEKYNIYPIGITKEGKWLLYQGEIKGIVDNKWIKKGVPTIISPDATHKGIIILKDEPLFVEIDMIFPVLHGSNGEDGTIQGLFQMAQIPYVGCGVLSSAVSMDKGVTKIIADAYNIPQAKYVIVRTNKLDNTDKIISKIESVFPYPYFIKPANAGSSVGISKANNKEELIQGLHLAAKYDTKILVEETIVGREVETAALGNEDVQISGVGEIIAGAEFYDYDAKYNNAESKTVVNADLPDEIKEQIRTYAKRIFKAVDGKGLARIDFFVTRDNKVIFNEINTLPGFTSISMYPMLWKAQGIETPELVEKLINLASL